MKHYVKSLDVPLVFKVDGRNLLETCSNDMMRRGWSEETRAATRVFLEPSVNIAITAYSHIEEHLQVYIALYTSLVTYLDDVVKDAPGLLKSFGIDLVKGRGCGHVVLDALAEIIREAPDHYGDYLGGLLLISPVRFISAIVMEQEYPSLTVSVLWMRTDGLILRSTTAFVFI